MADTGNENPAEAGLREAGDHLAEDVGAKPREDDPRRVDLGEAREGLPTGEMHKQSPEEKKARGRRNIAIALAVLGFVVLVYLTTFFRLAENLKSGGAG